MSEPTITVTRTLVDGHYASCLTASGMSRMEVLTGLTSAVVGIMKDMGFNSDMVSNICNEIKEQFTSDPVVSSTEGADISEGLTPEIIAMLANILGKKLQ
ncbi:hypothetical protein [Secundilactobacillus kimchicus]|uniref:hypothetical protein n=1 Tax=Secundilactobacillus kimchicus TaxID=528209 RepID=UPI0006D0B3A4|nr:hypothetical protein [Secundilactobacillus kimchicus]